MPTPHPSDTIAAIATPPGHGAITIIRLSGPRTYPIIDTLFHPSAPPAPSQRPPSTFLHGQIRCPQTNTLLDETLLLLFRAPHSYTGEDSVEIQCHGGTITAQRILDALFTAGARQADPGEFTKRAFLNGKMDLTQAEAVLDLISARSERAARLATAQLEKNLGREIQSLYNALLAISADIESMLDFPDDELPQSVPIDITNRLIDTSAHIQTLLSTWREGQLLREGAQIVIAGIPNVGKSTLLNLLTGHDRAIVTPHPGTTRDTIQETIQIQGYTVHITDTAGLRETPEEIEQEGIRRTHNALKTADLCIFILDASQPLSPTEKTFLSTRNPENTLILGNKIDLGQQIHAKNLQNLTFLPISLKISPNFDQIATQIIQKLIQNPSSADHTTLAISDRHKTLLTSALDEITTAIRLLQTADEAHYLPAATHSRSALEQIGHIFGKNCSEDLLDTIFSRFCVGK